MGVQGRRCKDTVNRKLRKSSETNDLFLALLFNFNSFSIDSLERSGSEESSGADGRNKEPDEYPSPKDKDKDEEIVKVFDGNLCMKRRTFRTITITRSASMDQLIAAALRAFHIHDDPKHYVVTDFYGKMQIMKN